MDLNEKMYNTSERLNDNFRFLKILHRQKIVVSDDMGDFIRTVKLAKKYHRLIDDIDILFQTNDPIMILEGDNGLNAINEYCEFVEEVKIKYYPETQ